MCLFVFSTSCCWSLLWRWWWGVFSCICLLMLHAITHFYEHDDVSFVVFLCFYFLLLLIAMTIMTRLLLYLVLQVSIVLVSNICKPFLLFLIVTNLSVGNWCIRFDIAWCFCRRCMMKWIIWFVSAMLVLQKMRWGGKRPYSLLFRLGM